MQQNTRKSSRILYADLLRIISAITVIAIHVSSARWSVANFGDLEWWVLNIGIATTRWAVPLFFLLSGMFLLNPNKSFSYKKLLTHSVPRILVPLLFWSFAYKVMAIGTNKFLGLREVTSDDYLETVTSVFFRSTSWFHLWFIYVLLALYLLTPILRFFVKYAQKRDVLYLFILYLLFVWLKPFYNILLPIPLGFAIPDLVAETSTFLLGYYLSIHLFTKRESIIIYIIGILCLLVQSYFYLSTSLKLGESFYPFYLSDNSFNIVFIAIAVFVFFKNITFNSNFIFKRLRDNKIVTILSECTFGVYLVHVVFLNIFSAYFKFETNTINPLIAFPLLIILTYICSLITTYFIKKIPIVGKWIV